MTSHLGELSDIIRGQPINIPGKGLRYIAGLALLASMDGVAIRTVSSWPLISSSFWTLGVLETVVREEDLQEFLTKNMQLTELQKLLYLTEENL